MLPGTWPFRLKKGAPSGVTIPSALATVTVGSLMLSMTGIKGVGIVVADVLVTWTLTVDRRVRRSLKMPE